MFNFKKIALFGAAGLAALSMSCSDNEDEPGGTISFNPAAPTSLGDGTYSVVGGVAANPGCVITGITVTVGGSADGVVNTATSVAAGTVYAVVNPVKTKACEGKAAGATISLKAKVTATFDVCDDASLETDATSGVVCGAAVVNEIPVRNVTVGGTGAEGSFVDVDGNVAYTTAQVAANASKIDLVYDGSGAVGGGTNKLYSAYDFGWDYDAYAVLQANEVAIAPLSALVDAATVTLAYNTFTTQAKVPETALLPFSTLIASFDDDAELEKFFDAAEPGFIDLDVVQVFVVFTTEKKYYVGAVDKTNAKATIKLYSLLPY